jgi:hypothetical protein
MFIQIIFKIHDNVAAIRARSGPSPPTAADV